MNIKCFGTQYDVRRLQESDLEAAYALQAQHPLFYQYCPPFITRQIVREDMAALPPGALPQNKYYLGFWEDEQLAAVLDLVLGWPTPGTAYIGLFMMDAGRQRQGEGSALLSHILQELGVQGFAKVRLGFAKGNPQSEHFWRKNGFVPTGEEKDCGSYTAVLMEKTL